MIHYLGQVRTPYFTWAESSPTMLLSFATCTCSAHVIASIKLSDFRLLSSMNRQLWIKRFDVWSKSEGVIKLTKALVFKRGLRSSQDFCQQSRLQRHSLSFFVDMSHSQWFERGSQKFSHKKFFFPQKNSSSKALPNGKCSARNTCIYFIVVLFYSPGQSSSSDVLFYWIGLRSLYVDQGLKR